MPSTSIRDLRAQGFSEDDLELARVTQAAQKRTGARVQSFGEILGATQHRAPRRHQPNPREFQEKAMRKRGVYDQAALLLDQQALRESSPERALKAREAAKAAKDLSAAKQLEFDFFGGGNVSLAFQYQDAVTERLRKSKQTLARQHQALAVLWQITRHLGWQSYECTKSAADLCEITGITPNNMSLTLNLLEDIGAIRRIKRGRVKIITVTPEGAFRGNVNEHGKAVEKYKLEVVEGGKTDV